MKKVIYYCCLILMLIPPLFFTGCTKDYYEITTINLNDTVSFSGRIIPIFQANCISSGCHNTGGIAPDLTAANAYSNLILYNLVDVENPEQSVLYQRINANVNPMPPSGKLSNDKIAEILAWITQGANDN